MSIWVLYLPLLVSLSCCPCGLSFRNELLCAETAFAGASMNYRRYMYFAQKADIEGNPEVASLLRSIAEGEAAASMGHMEFLESAACGTIFDLTGDPATNEPIGDTESNLKAAIASEVLCLKTGSQPLDIEAQSQHGRHSPSPLSSPVLYPVGCAALLKTTYRARDAPLLLSVSDVRGV
eukprot:6213639-Pleurochrysis_carterae.AAC.1